MKTALAFVACMAGILLFLLCLLVAHNFRAVASILNHIDQAAANVELASGQLAQASLNLHTVSAQLADKKTGAGATLEHVEAATRPLADPKTGVAPMLTGFVKSADSAAKSIDGAAGNLKTLTAAANTEVLEIGAAAVKIENSALPVTSNAAQLLGNANDALQDGRKAAPELLAAAKPALAEGAAFVKSARAIADQVSDAAPMFLDCRPRAAGEDCLFNRYQGSAKAFEKTMVAIQATGQHIQKITQPHWYDRLLGFALNGAVLYRNLNPVTSLTVTGAQILSGRQ